MVPGLRRRRYALPGEFSLFIEYQVQLARLAPELVVEGLFETFATLAVRPKQIIILQCLSLATAGPAGVTDYGSGERSLRIGSEMFRAGTIPSRHMIVKLV